MSPDVIVECILSKGCVEHEMGHAESNNCKEFGTMLFNFRGKTFTREGVQQAMERCAGTDSETEVEAAPEGKPG